MPGKPIIDSIYNYPLSQIFRPALLDTLQVVEKEQAVRQLLIESGLCLADENWSLSRGLDLAYNHLKKNYRCEYVYKNELATQLLLKYHKDNSATLLKEVNSSSSIADIVIINGATVAYEIKTELDKFDRLPTQLNSYTSIYEYVNVVTHDKAAMALLTKLDKRIGIMTLNQQGIIETVREAHSNSDLFDPSKALFTLRQIELVDAYQRSEGLLPKMGSALIYNFCSNWYLTLDHLVAMRVFKEALKSRKLSAHQHQLMSNVTNSIKILFLGNKLSKKYCELTRNNLATFR
jgi:hypothetical protein